MNTEKNIQSVKETVQKIVTVKNAKRLAALLVVCAIPLSGGAWYQHQQKAAVKAEWKPLNRRWLPKRHKKGA